MRASQIQKRILYFSVSVLLIGLFASTRLLTRPVSADTLGGEGFSLQVSPSPLIGTLKPGVTSTFDLQIRNTNSTAQSLKMGLRAFTINESTGQVQLQTNAPANINSFVSFSDPEFTIQAGQIATEHVTVATPASAGFTYSFAITVSQATPVKAKSGSSIQGSVAVFTLLSVDRPGATSKLELSQLSVGKHIYEFLPATVTLKLKNVGNTLVQPKGTIFIQRHSDDQQPIASIQLNAGGGYILPGTNRSLSVSWNDGLPHYASVAQPNGSTTQKLNWSGGDISKLRFGKYIAKVVAVYNDGDRDIPLTAEVSFWVIPWRILFGLLVILLFVLIGVFTIVRKSTKTIRKQHTKATARGKQDA